MLIFIAICLKYLPTNVAYKRSNKRIRWNWWEEEQLGDKVERKKALSAAVQQEEWEKMQQDKVKIKL